MLDNVLEVSRRLTMDFTRKIYVKFEALSTHVKKLETHVVQKGEAMKK